MTGKRLSILILMAGLLILAGYVHGYAEETEMDGLSIRLSEATAEPPERTTVEPARTDPLPEVDVRRLLERLPALPKEKVRQDFNWPPESPPAPRTGEVEEMPFPPTGDETPTETEPAGTLEVVRYAPEGDVPIAPQVSISFS